MKHFFSRHGRIYTLDGQWVGNATEISGGSGEATMCIDMIATNFHNTFTDAVITGDIPEFKIECTLEDPSLNIPEPDKIILTGLKFWAFYNDMVTRDIDFTYTRFEIHRSGVLDLDDLKNTYDVD